MPTKLKQLTIEGRKVLYSLSFDIDDFIGDGVWWLQIYDDNLNCIYDKPFTSNMGKLDERKILKVIQNEFITYRGSVL